MSNLNENIRVAFSSLFSNKLRAILTTLGIGIGIAAVITLVSLGQAAQDYVNRQFLSAGSDLIYVRAAAGFGAGFGGGIAGANRSNYRGPRRISTSTISQQDATDLGNNIGDVKNVVPSLTVNARTDFGASEVMTGITATTPDYFTILDRTVAEGRLFDDDDMSTDARVVDIGDTTATTLFPDGTNPIGQSVAIRGVPFKVIGVLAVSGGTGFGGNADSAIFVPLTAAYAHLETERSATGELPLSEIYLEADTIDNIDGIVASATDFLHTSHKIQAGQDNDFQITSQQDLVGSLTATIGVLTIFLSIIGGISLLVGGIGVMNIMLVTVTERTREIGLRKAVGARGWDVLSQFLTEATVLCFVGATAGLAISLAIIFTLGQLIPALEPSVSPGSIVLAIGVTSFIGIFFGMYPASRAAALSPIQALRSE